LDWYKSQMLGQKQIPFDKNEDTVKINLKDVEQDKYNTILVVDKII